MNDGQIRQPMSRNHNKSLGLVKFCQPLFNEVCYNNGKALERRSTASRRKNRETLVESPASLREGRNKSFAKVKKLDGTARLGSNGKVK